MGHPVPPTLDDDLETAQPATDYRRLWQAYRIRWLLALTLSFSWLPACAALFVLSRFRLHFPLLALTLMLLWLASALAAVWWAGEFRCPRCRRRYAAISPRKRRINWTRGLFDTVCANCKLRKFERA